ncbi:MAG: glycosyltransferase family 4 protein [Candidatus Rokuibacteriota bacterium]
MKITFLCPHLRIAGGVRAILTYADRLVGRGHQVDVIVPERRSGRAFWRPRDPPWLAWMPECRARIRLVPEWTPAELPDADAVVATAWQSAPAVAAAPSSRGARFYFVQHYESLYHGEPGLVDATYRLPLRKIVISSWLRDIMRERFASAADVLVTPVDGGLFRRVPVTLTGPRPRVLMLHHDYAWKGVADGLAAAARAREQGAPLHLVGFGVKAPRVRVPYDEFHANLPQGDLATLYSGADIYLCPSWDEGLGMPSMEAMACGAALVTYDNGGCRDYATEGVTARVARRRDVDDLAAKLASLVLEPVLRARVAAAGRELVTTVFDWDRAVTRMETILGTG